MATPHADFQAKRCSDDPAGIQRLSSGLGVRAPFLSLSRPTHALHRRPGLLTWLQVELVDGKRGRVGAASWLASPKPSRVAPLSMFTWVYG